MIRVLILACLVAAGGSARADVVYSFNPTSYSGPWQSGFFHGTTAAISVELTNAQVASGSFSFTQSVGGNTGDVSGITALSGLGDYLTPQSKPYENGGYFRVSMTFDAHGSITSDSFDIVDQSYGEELRLWGSGSSATGWLQTEDLQACSVKISCTVSGNWQSTATTAVPEPMSAALFGTALLGFGLTRIRRRA